MYNAFGVCTIYKAKDLQIRLQVIIYTDNEEEMKEIKETLFVKIKRIIVICIASLVMAVNIKTFVNTGGLYPGGATGLTVLIQRVADMLWGISLPYTLVNLLLNAVPIYSGFHFIGKNSLRIPV